MNLETLERESNGGTISARREERTFIAGESIVAGDWVAFDGSQSANGDKFLFVVQASTAANKKACFGVALTDADANDLVEVVIAGPVLANVHNLVAKDEFLIIGATGGETIKATTNDLVPIVGQALQAYVGAGAQTLCRVHRSY